MVLPDCWPNPAVVSAACFSKCAFQTFPGPIELPHHIVLLVPLHGPLGNQGRAVRAGFKHAYTSAGFLCRPEIIETIDTSCFRCIRDAYLKAICHDADFIVGPLTEEET